MTEAPEMRINERQSLQGRLADRLFTSTDFNRKIVSFQTSKSEPVYRWFKYKEGFSSDLVKYFLKEYGGTSGKLLDPFAGAGTTLFAGQELGWETEGIELLPVGVFVMKVREALNKVDSQKFEKQIRDLWKNVHKVSEPVNHISHIPITRDAFPVETELLLNKYLTYCTGIKDKSIQLLMKFAAFSILEEISFTRKDGQYLRWDFRSNRTLSGKPFNKGKVYEFEEALEKKLLQILSDIRTEPRKDLFHELDKEVIKTKPPIKVLEGSCLIELPKLKSNSVDFIVTSPPYCNRYDYTRTYALELVYLGLNNDQVRDLRQTMLSCTVENKEKIDFLKSVYSNLGQLNSYKKVIKVYEDSAAMREVNETLQLLGQAEKLNNKGVVRMVRNYFLELAFVIFEMSRVLKSGGYCVMVNDNVRYAGEEIPVDLILSDFAQNFGFNVEKIFVLPRGKGNSSQQMGEYGRTEIRKCIYLWRKN